MEKYTVAITNEETKKTDIFTGMDMVLLNGITVKKKYPEAKEQAFEGLIIKRGGGEEIVGFNHMKIPQIVTEFVVPLMEQIGKGTKLGSTYAAFLCHKVSDNLLNHEKRLLKKCNAAEMDKLEKELLDRLLEEYYKND